MAEPYLSEIRLFSFNFPPRGWALCNGQLLPIAQNQALFSLLGTMYGGDGRTTFGLPDLRGRTPIHVGDGFIQGQNGGQEAHTLTQGEMPAHNHGVMSSPTNGDVPSPAGALLGAASNVYRGFDNLTTLHPATITNVGGSQAHENRQPFTVINLCIALQGIFPSRN